MLTTDNKLIIQVVTLTLIFTLQFLLPLRLDRITRIKTWLINFGIGLINTLFLIFIFNPYGESLLVYTSEQKIGALNLIRLPYFIPIIASVFILDFVAYIWHIINHRIDFLWRFHATHHSDPHMEASTAYRFHLGELILSFIIRLSVFLITGIPLEGLILFEMIYTFNNLFIHSDIKVPQPIEKAWGLVFVTPKMHVVHHSEKRSQHDSNYGTIFSIWDRLFKTLLPYPTDKPIRLGIVQYQKPPGLLETLLIPFKIKFGSQQQKDD